MTSTIQRAAAPAPPPLACFACGSISSLMPTVVDLFNIYRHGKSPEIANWIAFTAVAILYSVFAGLFTMWWEPESRFKAVWIGISFSTIVTALLQNAPSMK
jgi:hypothetical protein